MDIRNVAIIAHVDHGKTTLVDGMLKQTHTFRDNQAEMQETTILDVNELEREKGITILAKNTSVVYKDTKINIIDTPGHADFSGEVERVISMADGAILVIDAAEGPLPQTQFVLQQAFEHNLKIIVVINKIDRKDARAEEVISETEELFLRLANKEEQLDFSVLYAIGREGKVWKEIPDDWEEETDLTVLFEEIIKIVPAPQTRADKPFKMQITTLDFDSYKGAYAIGKVSQGTIRPGKIAAQMMENKQLGTFTVQKVFTSQGLKRAEIAESQPGDIIALTGVPNVEIGQTITDLIDLSGYPAIKLGEPTLKINIAPNTSPFSGREGRFCTARQLEERLKREMKTNIGLKINLNRDGQGFIVAGRGELHLAVLIENLRRESYEMQVGKPQVILQIKDGKTLEPFEEATVEVDKSSVGMIVEEMGRRRGEMLDTVTNDKEITRMVYKISSRNLLGFRSDMLTKTRGNGLFASRFLDYFPEAGEVDKIRNGALIACEAGTATTYAIQNIQERGVLFIKPGMEVYEGMIVGLANKTKDIEVNACKTKHATNVRSNADIAIALDQPVFLSLEQSLDFLEDDELLEVTPKFLRLRKRLLSKIDRVRAERK